MSKSPWTQNATGMRSHQVRQERMSGVCSHSSPRSHKQWLITEPDRASPWSACQAEAFRGRDHPLGVFPDWLASVVSGYFGPNLSATARASSTGMGCSGVLLITRPQGSRRAITPGAGWNTMAPEFA
jgi:hypothetical protein